MTKLLRDISTLSDNSTYDVVRVLTVLAMIVFLLLACVDVAYKHSFDMMTFAAAFASIVASAATALRIKQSAEVVTS